MRTFSLRLMYGLLSRYNKISITLAYICVAALWLTLSELGLPRLETYLGLTAHSLETFGHIGFFLSTAITLYGLLQLHQRRMSSFASAAQSQQKELTYFYDLPLIGMAITSPRAEPAFKVNARLCEMLGYSKQELMALSWADITHPEDLATDHTLYQQLLSGECNGYEVEKRVFHKNGSLLNIHVNVQCLREENGSIQHVFSTVVDQTNAVQYAMQLAATNRLYQLLLCTNQAIARENDINMLLQSICEIAIQKGEFRLAWIGLLDQEGQLVATSHAAEQSDYLDSLHITLANYNSARPIAQAFSEGHYVVCNDIATDPETASLREQALLLNYRSFISFPLRVNGHISGTFNLYARHANAFDEIEISLLSELSNDIAFAIELADIKASNFANLSALKESQATLQLAMQVAKLSLWDLDLTHQTAKVSTGFFQALGLSEQESPISMAWWYSLMPPEDAEACAASLQYQLTENKQYIGLEYRIKHSDGSWRWMATTCKVIEYDEQDQAKRMLGINMDITQRIDAEQQLTRDAERSDGLLALAVEESSLSEKSLLQYGLDLAEKLTASKIGFLHFVNEDEQTIQLAAWSNATYKQCRAAFDQHYPISQAGIWAECVTLRRPIICNDYAQASNKKGLPNGHFPLVRFISLPVIRDNKVCMIMGVGNCAHEYQQHDVNTLQMVANDLWRISRRRRVEADLQEKLASELALNQQLEQTQRQLLQSEKMAAIGQLAAGVAHELNNPIGFVHSNLGTLEGYVNDLLEITETCLELKENISDPCPQLLRLTQLIHDKDYDFLRTDLPSLIFESKEGLNRVKHIVQDLKNFSHTGESIWEWADLHKGLDSTLNIVWNELKYKCEVIKDYAEIPEVYCLPSQINQVFMNLLVNASHAIEKHGCITLRSSCTEDSVSIEISDTGKGIAPEHLPRIFEPFFTTKPVGQGTGLGLSLSYSIIQKHKGQLRVHSELGQGTSFIITLPINPHTAPKESHHD